MPRRSFTVLGINDGHDASAAIVRDGKVVAAIQEERLVNIKHYSGVPEKAITNVFKVAGIHPDEIDAIAIGSLLRVVSPLKEEQSFKVRLFKKLSPFIAGTPFIKLFRKVLHRFRKMKELNKVFAKLGILDKEVIFVEHHVSHAACAYRQCPWSYDEPVLVFTADGAGDLISSTVNVCEHGEINRIAFSPYYDSLGNAFYSEITRYLGLKPWDHEYKVMGLAPYGKAEYCIDAMKKIIRIDPKNKLKFKNTIRAYGEDEQRKLWKLLKGQRFDNIAAAAQLWLEHLLMEWIKNAIEATGVHKIACAGGVFLNVKANKRILEMEEVDDAFFYPVAGDDGTAAGAALEAYYMLCKRDGIKPRKTQLEDLYYGPSFINEEIEVTLKKHGLLNKAEYYDNIDEIIGELIAKGKVVARFNGRLEYGPRALGNRSILADPRDYRTVWKVNFQIKQRDFWMPFAPTILEEDMHLYLVNPRPARYMILAFDTTEKRNEIIATIHPKDHTCRPQTLNEWNPSYRKVLETFREITGVSAVLNTSFNLHGYPIVGTPQQAIWTYKNSKLDALAIGNYLVMR